MPGCRVQRGCHAVVAVALAGSTWACGPRAAAPHVAGTTQVYRCADGTVFVARYERERAWLFLEGNAVSAAQVPAGSALHYSNGTVTLTGDPARMRLTIGRDSHDGCVAQPDEVAWADARLRGIHLRAAGRDPEWVLEIREGRDIVLRGAPAGTPRRAAFPHIDLASESAAQAYDVADAEGRWVVTLARGACADAVPPDAAPPDAAPPDASTVRVQVHVDGRTLTGCGRFLR